MTTGLDFLATYPNRCPRCLFDITEQGHSAEIDGRETGCTPSGPLGLMLARKARDKGMQRAEAAHPGDVKIVDDAIELAMQSGREFSANDLRYLVAQVEQPAVIGSRFRAAIASKRLKQVGQVPSNSPGTHAHKIGVYVASDAA